MSEIDRLRAAFPESAGWECATWAIHANDPLRAAIRACAWQKEGTQFAARGPTESAAVDACIAARDAVVEGSELVKALTQERDVAIGTVERINAAADVSALQEEARARGVSWGDTAYRVVPLLRAELAAEREKVKEAERAKNRLVEAALHDLAREREAARSALADEQQHADRLAEMLLNDCPQCSGRGGWSDSDNDHAQPCEMCGGGGMEAVIGCDEDPRLVEEVLRSAEAIAERAAREGE